MIRLLIRLLKAWLRPPLQYWDVEYCYADAGPFVGVFLARTWQETATAVADVGRLTGVTVSVMGIRPSENRKT
jgi:hypothetical protein